MFKKVLAVILAAFFLFSGCGRLPEVNTPSTTDKAQQGHTETEKDSFVGVWISYIEISSHCESEDAFTRYMNDMFLNFSRVGVTDVFFHVRPFADALYPSELFPSSVAVCENQGDELKCDYLSVALSVAENYGMKLHAWINPYRASKDADITALSEENKARIWCEEEGNNSVFSVGGRYYFNPACENVCQLIVDGVKELLENYPGLAGIHIDDYFYPESCGDFDKAEYERYCQNGGTEDLTQWRRDNVSGLVRELYSVVKGFSEEKIFSVSPTGKINTCLNELYADVELWCSQEGYCDIILPQIYFGFENESQPFEECLEGWIGLCESSDVKLAPALALYKCGQQDAYAGEKGEYEWTENNDIIKRQVESIKAYGLYGFGLYSGSYVNFSESFYKKELDNLISVL